MLEARLPQRTVAFAGARNPKGNGPVTTSTTSENPSSTPAAEPAAAKPAPVKRKASNGLRFLVGGYSRYPARVVMVATSLVLVTLLHLSIPWMVGQVTSYLEIVREPGDKAHPELDGFTDEPDGGTRKIYWEEQRKKKLADPNTDDSHLVGSAIAWADSTPQMGQADIQVIYLLCGVLAGLFAIRSVLQFIHIYQRVNLTQRCTNTFRQMVFNKVTRLGFGELGKIPTGEIISRGLRDVMKAQSFVADIFWNVVETVLFLFGAIALIWQSDWRLMMAGLTCLPIAVAMMYISTRQMKMQWKATDKKYDRISDTLHDSIVGVRVVKAFGTEEMQRDRFSHAVNRFANRVLEAGDVLSSKIPKVEVLFNLTTPITLVVGIWLYSEELVDLGAIVAAVLLMRNMAMRLRNVGNQLNQMQDSIASAERIQDFLDVPERIASVAQPTPYPAQGGDLVFENVSFKHQGQGIVEREEFDKYVDEEEEAEKRAKAARLASQPKELAGGQHPDQNLLEGINLRVPQGSTLGICGPTGSGKSTLVSLMLRLYDPNEGSIKIGGVEMRQIDVVELRRRVTMVFQETFLFSATVADNIAMGNPAATDQDVLEAARRAQADDFIQGLSERYDTVIGERGVDLSGGQKQRLALARALCMQPRILILDDSSAALDPETESMVRGALESMDTSMTRIVISSRLATLRRTQKIVVLEKGRVAGYGSHAELMANCALYRELFAAQLQETAAAAEARGRVERDAEVDLGELRKTRAAT